jgi:hypothetical protein
MARGAGALAALLLAAGCAGCADTGYTVRRGEAATPGVAPPAVPGALRVLHVADFGEVNRQQASVASNMAAAHRRGPFALALFPGDNIYPCGPSADRPGAEKCQFGPDRNTVVVPPEGTDPAFARQHEAPLEALSGPGAPRVLLTLGNHDVATRSDCALLEVSDAEIARRRACAAVAHQAPRWSMPGRHYVVDEGPARFIFVDSNVIYADYAGFTLDDEVRFVAEAALGCATRTCFLVGHHPPATAGGHLRDFDAPERGARMRRLVAAAGPDLRAYLAGHDHDLQHLRTAAGLDVFISGNGCCARPEERFERTSDGGPLLFASVQPGFGALSVDPDGWSYRFEDASGPLYCCAAAGKGRCLPVDCAP